MNLRHVRLPYFLLVAATITLVGCAPETPTNTVEGLSESDVEAYDKMVEEDFNPMGDDE